MGSYAFCFYVEVRLVRLDQYSERNVTNFEAGHNLDRNSFLKVKKEVPQEGKEKHSVSATDSEFDNKVVF